MRFAVSELCSGAFIAGCQEGEGERRHREFQEHLRDMGARPNWRR